MQILVGVKISCRICIIQNLHARFTSLPKKHTIFASYANTYLLESCAVAVRSARPVTSETWTLVCHAIPTCVTSAAHIDMHEPIAAHGHCSSDGKSPPLQGVEGTHSVLCHVGRSDLLDCCISDLLPSLGHQFAPLLLNGVESLPSLHMIDEEHLAVPAIIPNSSRTVM